MSALTPTGLLLSGGQARASPLGPKRPGLFSGDNTPKRPSPAGSADSPAKRPASAGQFRWCRHGERGRSSGQAKDPAFEACTGFNVEDSSTKNLNQQMRDAGPQANRQPTTPQQTQADEDGDFPDFRLHLYLHTLNLAATVFPISPK